MEIIYKKGNLLDAQTDVIAHQVNCQGVMGSGVAKQIKEKWPRVFEEYRKFYQNLIKKGRSDELLGCCQTVNINDNLTIANLFGQQYYGRSKGTRYTNYEALYSSLETLWVYMIDNCLESVAFPYKMSSDRGGADWDVVLAMIKSVFKDTDITIEIWKYVI